MDTSYNTQRVHVNRVKSLFETMLWKDESFPLYEEAATKTSKLNDQQPNGSDRKMENKERSKSEEKDTD